MLYLMDVCMLLEGLMKWGVYFSFNGIRIGFI